MQQLESELGANRTEVDAQRRSVECKRTELDALQVGLRAAYSAILNAHPQRHAASVLLVSSVECVLH